MSFALRVVRKAWNAAAHMGQKIEQLAILTAAEGDENSTMSYAVCMECCCQQPPFF
jgi:hypothetical protein